MVVASKPRGVYRRVAAAVDLAAHTADVVQLALQAVGQDAGEPPLLRVIHAFDVPFDGLVYAERGAGPERRYRAEGRLFLGSVAEDLLREARCDVLVWRPPGWSSARDCSHPAWMWPPALEEVPRRGCTRGQVYAGRCEWIGD